MADKKEYNKRTKLEKLLPVSNKTRMFKREQTTIVLKEKEQEPIRSLFFKDEFINEKNREHKFLS